MTKKRADQPYMYYTVCQNVHIEAVTGFAEGPVLLRLKSGNKDPVNATIDIFRPCASLPCNNAS